MAISHHDRIALKPITNNVSLSPTSRRSSTIRLLTYIIMLGCVLGILQPSAIVVSAASALPRPAHSEDLNVVGIDGQQHIGDSYGFHSEASESHRGEILRKRYAAGEIQDDQGSNDIKAGVNDKQISQTNTQPAAPLTTQTIKDENQPTSTTIPLTEVITTSEKIEGTITQSAAEKAISETEVQSTSTPTETIQNTNLFTSESLVPQISETSLQSGPSPTRVSSQKPTTGSVASSSLTSKSGGDLSQATPASIDPKIPASAVSVSVPTLSLAILPSGKASDTLVSTPLIATSSQIVPEASTTTIGSEATLAPEESASSTEPVLSVTQEITIPDITPSPNQFTTELPAQSSVEESSLSLTTTAKTAPAFVPTGIATVGDAVDAVDGAISPILDTAKGVLPVIPSNALSGTPSATTSFEPVTSGDKALGSTAVPKTNIFPTTRIEEVGGEDVTTTAQPSPTEISISSGAQANDQVRASQTEGPNATSGTQRNDQSQTSVSSDPGPTTTSEDSGITTATSVASNSTNTQGLPLNTTKAAATNAVLIEIPTSNVGDTITTGQLAPIPLTSNGSLQPQSTEVPTSTGTATDASTTTTNTLATSATTSVAVITTPVTTDVSTAITSSVATPVTSSATAITSTTGITSTTDVTTGNTAIVTTSTSASEIVSVITSATSTPDKSFTSTSITATTGAIIDVTSVSTSDAITSSSTDIFTGSETTTSITIPESTTFTAESSTVTQPTSSSVGDSTTSTATSQPEQTSSSASLQVLPVIAGAINTTSTTSSAATTTTVASTTEESSTASSSVVQSSAPLSSLSQTSELLVPTGTSTQTTTSTATATAEDIESTSISPIALQSVTIGSSSFKSATNPTTFITATYGATKPSIISSSSLSTDSSKTVKGSPSEGANSNPPQTAPAVTPTPATPVDVPEVVVPITRASDIPPSAEATAGNTVDKDGNKVQIVAFYDATSGETFGTDRATVFEGSAVNLSTSVSLIFVVITALVGQLFFS